MMQETQFFRTTSSMDDTLFQIVNKSISIRQTIILGVGCGLVFFVFLATNAENVFIFPFIIIPLVLGISRTKTMTADAYLRTILSFLVNSGSTKRIKAAKSAIMAKRVPSMRMGLRPEIIKDADDAETSTIRKIPVIDTSKSVRLNITIQGSDGSQYSNRFVSIFLDGKRVGAASTDVTGRVAISVIPKKLGIKRLRVMPKDGDEPLLDGMVEFVEE